MAAEARKAGRLCWLGDPQSRLDQQVARPPRVLAPRGPQPRRPQDGRLPTECAWLPWLEVSRVPPDGRWQAGESTPILSHTSPGVNGFALFRSLFLSLPPPQCPLASCILRAVLLRGTVWRSPSPNAASCEPSRSTCRSGRSIPRILRKVNCITEKLVQLL